MFFPGTAKKKAGEREKLEEGANRSWTIFDGGL